MLIFKLILFEEENERQISIRLDEILRRDKKEWREKKKKRNIEKGMKKLIS